MTQKAELLKVLEGGIKPRGDFSIRGCRKYARKAYQEADACGYKAISAALATLVSPDAPKTATGLKIVADHIYNEAADLVRDDLIAEYDNKGEMK